MANRLYGFLTDLMTNKGHLVTGSGERKLLTDVSARDEVIIFAPGTDISLLSVVLPARSEAEARRAAPFAVEDEIAVSIEDAHFAIGPAGSDVQKPRSLHVVSLAVMEAWSEWLSGIPQLQGAQLIAEHSMLSPGQAFAVEDRVLANIEGRVFSFDRAMPEDLLGALLGEAHVDSISNDALLLKLAKNYESSDVLVNLCQGPFRSRNRRAAPSFKEWRLSACLAAALALSWGVYSLVDISSMRKQKEDIETAIATAYAQALPDAPKPTNYVRAVSQEVNAQKGGGHAISFRGASAALYAALAAQSNAQLLSLRYDSEDGVLIASIAYAAYGDDAALKSALTDTGFDVTLGDVRQERAGVVGDVTLRMKTS